MWASKNALVGWEKGESDSVRKRGSGRGIYFARLKMWSGAARAFCTQLLSQLPHSKSKTSPFILCSIQQMNFSADTVQTGKEKKKKALHNLFPSCVLTAGSEMDDPAMKSPPSTILKNYVIVGSSQISGQAALFHPSGQKSSEPHGRGQVTTPTGSPHLAAVHLPLPPSRVIEELHRALATKHRQDRYLQPPGSRAA